MNKRIMNHFSDDGLKMILGNYEAYIAYHQECMRKTYKLGFAAHHRELIANFEQRIFEINLELWQRSQAEARSARLHAAEYQDYLDTVSDTRYAGCL